MKQILVPELSESVSEATLLDWQKAAGDAVAEGDVLVEIETDKITMEVPAPCGGVLTEIKAAAGTDVKSGDLLALLDETAAGAVAEAKPAAVPPPTPAPAAPPAAPAAKTSPTAMPSAKKIAAESGVDLQTVAGSGKDGRITKGDVLAAAAGGGAAAALPAGPRATHRVPMSKLRARVAERLMESQHGTATLTTFNEVNMQAVMDIRAAHRDAFEKKHGVKLGFMSFFVKACVAALKEFPVVNAAVDGGDIVYNEYYDIGVAVGSPRGLVVPVVRDADLYSMAEVEKTIADFGARAQTGALALEEITGGTFSITNGGVFGSMLSTPILNPPQSAILGVHATRLRLVVEDGDIVARPMCYFALSYDHRIIDGREAVLFLSAVKNALEDPARLLLEL